MLFFFFKEAGDDVQVLSGFDTTKNKAMCSERAVQCYTSAWLYPLSVLRVKTRALRVQFKRHVTVASSIRRTSFVVHDVLGAWLDLLRF